ncbi:mechanosensitive ion channel protein MscS [Sphingomonas melonis TY]|jgi:small-conductance mechanosensitive channel|nr:MULTISPECIES: mechanosensitive ion channel family protein [Sphingomonas]AOW23043.1 mechanosensitive ion channel protein MscS [Sphingomonas melonis TY]ATI56467.1 mechanosensitive ion channel family protein [Sphingomonas melonis]KZB94440.1 mechanosensitive ion channel protein MscS [Sphingomonas melonis TY]MBI0529969.1 mechanosensitive ion channel family protein [Sphingomonas sp. TX0522]MBX8845348.1 mechanosensitive ion channel family protein [Sphingomonas melonis]
MSKTTTATASPIFDSNGVQDQLTGLYTASEVWLHTHWLQILIALAVGVVIVVALHGLRRLGERLCRRRDVSGVAETLVRRGWGAIVGRAIARTNNFFIVMLAAKLVAGYAGAPSQVSTTINFLWTVASVFQAAIWARELILGAIEHRTSSEHYSGEALLSAMGLIRLLVTVALFAVALVVVLDNLGVNVTGLIAGLGVGGIAIGLAAQGIFGDLFAALAIIFDRPFRRGDKISYGTTNGVIESIGLKSTRIRAFTGELRVISNKQLLDKEIQNISVRDHIRLAFTIGVTYETPPDSLARVPQIMREIVEGEGGKVARSSFETFGASSLDFVLQFDIPGDDWATAHPMRDRIMVSLIRRFAAEGIGIAYPTQTTYTAGPDGKLVMPYAPAS